MKLGTTNSDSKIQSIVPKEGIYLCMGLMNVNMSCLPYGSDEVHLT